MCASVPDVDTHLLFYDYVDDILERRGPFREAHLERIRAAQDRGEVTLAGAVGDPPHAAVIVFQGAPPEQVEAFAREDPYVQAGLVASWRIEPWKLV
jgi:uncharacterized protein